MKEWFKAQKSWGAAIQSLSDVEVGRLMKAVWHYATTGEQRDLSGGEKVIFALITMELSQNEAKDALISKKRSEAGSLGGKQRVANASKCYQIQANATFAKQNVAKESNASNKEVVVEVVEDDSSLFINSEEAGIIRSEHERVLDAAEIAGFDRTDYVRSKLIDLYADNGLEKMLSAIEACAEHGAPTVAYLKGVLKGGPRKQSQNKAVPAQQYAQRDYSGADEEAMKRMLEMAEENRA